MTHYKHRNAPMWPTIRGEVEEVVREALGLAVADLQHASYNHLIDALTERDFASYSKGFKNAEMVAKMWRAQQAREVKS